jgi:hypothetical protein
MAWVEIHHEVPNDRDLGDWVLCFQECTYHYDNNTTEDGFRFIWRKPDGSLQAARGQARIPDAQSLYELINAAIQDGWFNGSNNIE